MSLVIGVPKETLPGEKRVAATPESIKKIKERGLGVRVERGAGLASGISDDAYVAAGAEVADSAWDCDVVFKVRPPTAEEIARLKEGAFIASLMQPERNPYLVDALKAKKVTALALERIPRVTRAQKMDVLSSMANLSGYRAVVEAAAHYQGFFGPQITAAGASPPAKVLIIGAGVAGLAALGAARALGAQVRAFDTRAAAREQVESLGGEFLEVKLQESGEGQGGYAKVMSPEFIAAEMELFRQQAREVDVIITTALVPGTKAPTLVPRDVVECLKPGSVLVDMAAEQGGNCELTKPDEVVVHNGVKILGFTDLASRMAVTSSRFFSMNFWHLLGEFGKGDSMPLDLENDVVRPALLVHKGETLPPLPPKAPPPPKPAAAPAAIEKKPVAPPSDAKPKQEQIQSPVRKAWGSTFGGIIALGLLFLISRFAPADFLQHSTVFVLACFVGWQVVWAVSPALHTPLMSVTNAISGIIIVGGMLQVGAGLDVASLLGAAAVLFAAINIAGGFLVTQRMLKMFQAGAPSKSSSHGGHH